MHYALCAFVEYPASALLSEEHEHGVKERGGGGEEEKEEGDVEGEEEKEEVGEERVSRFLSRLGPRDRNVTLYSYQVDI
jgi:hypothetical protein